MWIFLQAAAVSSVCQFAGSTVLQDADLRFPSDHREMAALVVLHELIGIEHWVNPALEEARRPSLHLRGANNTKKNTSEKPQTRLFFSSVSTTETVCRTPHQVHLSITTVRRITDA